MEFNYFGIARDMLYLCFFLSGAAVAAFLVTLRKNCTLRKKSLWITVILCLASCVAASLSASVILSNGMIFGVTVIYPFAVLFFILGGIALYFPRAGGCSIIFAGGLFVVFISFSFLSFPGFKKPLRLVVRSSGDELLFQREADTWNVQNDRNTILFEAVSITAYPAYPFIGGERRGVITRVLRNDSELFALQGGHGQAIGFSREILTLDLPVGTLAPGTSLSVLFDGNKLYFYPPIQM